MSMKYKDLLEVQILSERLRDIQTLRDASKGQSHIRLGVKCGTNYLTKDFLDKEMTVQFGIFLLQEKSRVWKKLTELGVEL